VLGIEENRIKVIPVECGGGFGGKIRALCEPIAALLARATGRPVRYVMTRREEREARMPAPQVIIRLETGAKRDGSLMRWPCSSTARLLCRRRERRRNEGSYPGEAEGQGLGRVQ
jgi:CO/xanthine dehydrogenase Mo-binding subunit